MVQRQPAEDDEERSDEEDASTQETELAQDIITFDIKASKELNDRQVQVLFHHAKTLVRCKREDQSSRPEDQSRSAEDNPIDDQPLIRSTSGDVGTRSHPGLPVVTSSGHPALSSSQTTSPSSPTTSPSSPSSSQVTSSVSSPTEASSCISVSQDRNQPGYIVTIDRLTKQAIKQLDICREANEHDETMSLSSSEDLQQRTLEHRYQSVLEDHQRDFDHSISFVTANPVGYGDLQC